MSLPSGSIRTVIALLYRRHPRLAVILVLVGLLFGLCEAALIGSVYPMTAQALAGIPNISGAFLQEGLDVSLKTTWLGISSGLWIFALFAVLSHTLAYAKDVLRNYAALSVRQGCQDDIMARWMCMDYRTAIAHKQGDILFKICAAPGGIGAPFIHLPELLAQAVKVTAVVSLLCLISLPAALVVGGLGAGFFAVNRVVTHRYSYRVGHIKAKSVQEQTSLVSEALSGIRELTIYGGRDRWVRAFAETVHRFNRAMRDAAILRAAPGHLLMIGFLVVAAGALMLGRLQTGGTGVELLPLLATVGFATYRMIPVVSDLGNMTGQIRESLPYVEIVAEELRDVPTLHQTGGIETIGPIGAIKLQNVAVTYGKDKGGLCDVSLELTPGVTALVGPSGSGKSTIVNLIAGLFQPSQGLVLVESEGRAYPLPELSRALWAGKLGFVGQDPLLVYGSVAENIAFGRPLTREAIEQAARAAGAADFISQLPKGFDTLVGERGLELSGGQRQRLAIARALAQAPEILILDEATSALDYESERQVQRVLRGHARTKIVLTVAHRLSMVRFADRVVVLSQGRLMAQGPAEAFPFENAARGLFPEVETMRWVPA